MEVRNMSKMHRAAEQGIALGWALPAAVAVLAGISLYGVVSLARERSHSQELASSNQNLRTSLQQVQRDMRAMSDKMNALVLVTQSQAAAQQSKPAAHVSEGRVRIAAVRPARKPVEDARFRKLEANLATQQKELADARQQADQSRQELESKLNLQRDELSGTISRSHDELNGSIARNHDELVALQRRGERNYYEFNLTRSKQFQHVGPLNLSLRRVNQKHKYYDLVMTIDDQQLEKKHVTLYEPLMLSVSDRPQPIELVVNSISDNQVKGYVSEARYKKSELAATTPEPAPDAAKTLQRR
jgi:hypothetical protein